MRQPLQTCLFIIVFVTKITCQLLAQEITTSGDPFASDSTPRKAESIELAGQSISSGHRETIDRFASMFPSSQFDPLVFESTLDPLKPLRRYCYCFKTGALVCFDFFPAKSSRFTIFLLPVKNLPLRDAELIEVDEEFVSNALQLHPSLFLQFLNGAGGKKGMGSNPQLNISLPPDRLIILRQHKVQEKLMERTAEEESDK